MKILLFGGSGQLGHEVRKRAADLDFELISPVSSELDITDRAQVKFLLSSVKPDVVINSAAYTAVDKAEDESDRTFAINADGARYIAEGCVAVGARMIHISTDYVFDGLLGRELREDDATNAVSVYGRSKLAGEEAVRDATNDTALIIRTQALYGKKGVNFVYTMLKLFEEREVVKVVSDQWVSPTWAGWLAETLLDLVRTECSGVVHASCRGAVSWFDFAQEIMGLARGGLQGKRLARLEPTTAEELGRPARRPVYSAFDTSKLTQLLGRPVLSWQEGLQLFLREVGLTQ